MNKENKKFCIKALAAAAALLFLISLLFPFVRSLLVMQIWNQVQKSGSLLEDTASVENSESAL